VKYLLNGIFYTNKVDFIILSSCFLMRGYCDKCKEYRSDNGMDAWRIIWRNDLAICERCGSVVDVWRNKDVKKNLFNED
jgi:hypothetical protein